MSFILDALKKAESERSRSAGPVLMDVRVAQSRQRLPGWAWILVCVLLANLALLAWMLLRKPVAQPVVAAAPAANVATAPATVVEQPALPAGLPPPQLPSPPPATVADPVLIPAPATAAPVPAPLPSTGAPPDSGPPAAAPSASPRIDNLPTYQDLVAQGVALPGMQLSLHVYDEAPANRYVLLNSRRLREGDEVADGVRVETIVPRGVVLSVRGRRFVLLAGT